MTEQCAVLEHILRLDSLVHRGDLTSLHYFHQLGLVESNDHIFRLEVRVNDSALAVQVVQPDQDLLGHSANQRQRNTLIVVSFHDLKQIYAEDFEHHDEVLTIGARMNERIQ